jgi:hypothetical protein
MNYQNKHNYKNHFVASLVELNDGFKIRVKVLAHKSKFVFHFNNTSKDFLIIFKLKNSPKALLKLLKSSFQLFIVFCSREANPH